MDLNKFKNLKSPYILILVGPPLSGKSFFCNKFISEIGDVDVISRDAILLDVYGSDNYDEAFKNVNQRDVDVELQNKLVQSSKSNRNVIIDMTNMTSKRRSHNLKNFNSYTKIAVIFPILEFDEYNRRNDKRKSEENKFIPEQVLRNMIGSYQPIRESEGFDKVITI